MILWALQILERSRKPRCRNLSSRRNCGRACVWPSRSLKHERHNSHTRSRNSTNVSAWLPWRLLTAETLEGQLKRDRTSERHSLEVTSKA